jgi:hypothetical protein
MASNRRAQAERAGTSWNGATRQYLVRYPDVAASGLNALAHYETHDRREKRNIPLLKG